MSLLALFPLNLVLLPGVPLPLHIFEPRYREMIAECIEHKRPFGIVRMKDEGIAEIGCTAEILQVTKQHPDGSSDILTQGGRRFEILQIDQERAFLQAEVFYLDDAEDAASAADVERAVKLQAEILALAGAQAEVPSSSDPKQNSFRLAGSLPLDLDFKQSLLEMKSETERIKLLISYFETLLPDIRRTLRARKKAGGNGHAR